MAAHYRRVLDVLTAHRDDDTLLTLCSTLHPFGMRRAHSLHSWMAATSSRADAAFVSQLGLCTVGVSYALCGRRGNTLVSDPATLITLEYGQSFRAASKLRTGWGARSTHARMMSSICHADDVRVLTPWTRCGRVFDKLWTPWGARLAHPGAMTSR